MKILVAEDTRDLNRALEVILEQSGYEVTCVFDGREALDRALSQSFDGIILDIMMPKMDGLEALREMRGRGIVAPVLLLTAKAEVDDRVVGLDAGADDYLPKPFAMKELLARVRALCKRRSGYSDVDLSFGDIRLRADTFELACENTVRLSVKELELMQLLIRNADHPLASEFVLGRIWEDDRSATGETLALYVSYLRAKLKAVASTLAVMVNDEGGIRLVAREVAVR
ncbi:transcriptional regulator [Olsenella sp. oral taxon 807]|jgi:response regulator with cheY-like receiver domain and winged-helix DNA-binding domain|uniref:response regulator transcription factor n=1 Tax=Olsenella sp. oral taxon 807 TaxID=712411 RepID=UPI00067A20B5|nr:response regulator transcription factor [Olsenella sp. oral taxon 807]AKT48295.1 transcriptional regulator [Olsenella sp. oral taxon 807]